MNQVQTIWKNPLNFVYDPILPLLMNQAKLFGKILKNCKWPYFATVMTQAKTIQLNPRKIQNDPILLR